MIIGIDFDGTCVTYDYPDTVEDIGSAAVLRKLVNKGHKLVLYTMRFGLSLHHAEAWFGKNKIPLYGVNENPSQKEWTTSPKVHAGLFIDDRALGCPLIYPEKGEPYVDWGEVEKELRRRKLL